MGTKNYKTKPMPEVRPHWGRGADGGLAYRSKAEEEDAATRKAYHREKLRSPYLLQIAIPDSVRAGDHATARSIANRIAVALDQTGKWTKPERARLRVLFVKWDRRAKGDSTIFNIRGWMAQHNPDRWFARDKAVADLFDSITNIIHARKGITTDDN